MGFACARNPSPAAAREVMGFAHAQPILRSCARTSVAPVVPRVFAFCVQANRSIVLDLASPGGINSPYGLIVFDGVCVLCSRGCRFVSKRDRRGYFRFVPMQLAEGRSSRNSSGSILTGRTRLRSWHPAKLT